MGIGHVIWSVLVGFVIGLVARAIMPGADHMGFLATSVLGIVGSLAGGFLGSLVSKPHEGATFHPAGFALSVVGAMIVLFVWQRIG
ncbi:MAG: GlsB/YeaQ/YmgE family stress response membrane protein [Candidatus Binatia bacterium]